MKRIISSILTAFSVIFFIAVCFIWAGPFWPYRIWWIASTVLISPLWCLLAPPVIMFLAGVFSRSKSLVGINFISVMIIVFFVMNFNIPFHIPDQDRTGLRLRVMTYNVGEMIDEKVLSAIVSETNPDIAAFQEVGPAAANVLKKVFQAGNWNLRIQDNFGVATRLKVKSVEMKKRNIAGGYGGLVGKYVLESDMYSINFFNLHLETLRDGLEALISRDIKGGVSDMIKITDVQLKESAIVSSWIKAHDTVIVAGDFNMTVLNPIYKNNWAVFKDAFSEAGFGFGYTKFTSKHGVRIDHILCDNNWRVVRSRVVPGKWVDHAPLIADMIYTGSKPSNKAEATAETIEEGSFEGAEYLISERFDMSLGGFKEYGAINISLSSSNSVRYGDVLEAVFGKDSEGVISRQVDPWRIEDYPMVSFDYKIPDGVSLGVRVRTMYDDWVYLGGTPMFVTGDAKVKDEIHLINDGRWHEIDINAGEKVRTVLPLLKYLKEFQLFVNDNNGRAGSFWIDNFKIYQKL